MARVAAVIAVALVLACAHALEKQGEAMSVARAKAQFVDPAAHPNDFPEAEAGEGRFVPFGKHVPRQPNVNYFVATGRQECSICQYIIGNAAMHGPNFHNLCNGLVPEYMDMCEAQKKVLQSCPEFSNNWCYQDLGGTQQLLSPCPGHLVCHYCLGMNPLYCA